MYFFKPADSLVPTGGGGNVGGEPVASAAVPPLPAVPAAPAGTPDVAAAPPLPLPSTPPATRIVPERPIPVVQPVAQPPAEKPFPKLKDEDNSKYTTLPSRDKIFVIYTDEELERAVLARLRQDEIDAKRDPYQKYPKDLRFPAVEDVSGGVAYKPKTAAYPPMQTNYDPLYVVHRRLIFEEKNAERYGWDFGFVQPIVSSMYFYKDVILWPNHLASGCAYGFWDTNAGKCLPGSPTPYMLYPPGLTITGGVFETVLLIGLNFALP
jgi:hypothetical protein